MKQSLQRSMMGPTPGLWPEGQAVVWPSGWLSSRVQHIDGCPWMQCWTVGCNVTTRDLKGFGIQA